ncbi:MAG TPA: 50S ribosomal protein L30 [Candidatus Aminicenantes bacterium]|nr:50S ribosomal protein L30 [Candidatus Aminicenantes bacterium]
MAKKKEVSKEVSELKKEIKEGKVILGANRVLKELKAGSLSKVYLAKNCPSEMKKDIEYYSRLENIPLQPLNLDNEEVGILCKKHFFISVLGVKKK